MGEAAEQDLQYRAGHMTQTADIRVSVLMANHNGAAHIAAAVRSVLRQTERALELILSDDGSTDDSTEIARGAAAGDPRFVLVRGERGGPAAARNRALKAARGRWIAIVDNDDLIHPERLEFLLEAAEIDRADIVADDLITFYQDGSRAPHPHLRDALADAPFWISAAAYERSNRLLGPGPALGYLKPVFKRSLGARYNESLRIGEDSDLILRLLMAGARMRTYPLPYYFYRKHAASISHRLSAETIDAMAAAYANHDAPHDPALGAALSEQRAAIRDARAFTDFIDAVKARRWGGALGAAVKRPGALLLLRDAVRARLLPQRRAPALPGPRVTLVSRQRIVGANNGSSAYVLALAAALRDAGFAVDYVGASPKIFGRWAMLRLKPEIAATFDRYLVHGGLRVGDLVLATSPGPWIASALAVLDRGLGKLGLKFNLSRPAEQAQDAEATRADMLYVARTAAPGAQAVLCDYAFLTPMAPFAMAADAPVLVIMHDLISGRVADEAAEQATSKVTTVTAAEEFQLLGLADVVLAIQAEEAAQVRAALPGAQVILAPHGVSVMQAAQTGEDDRLLFVGSNTAPNIVGLDWFFREIWPLVRAARPDARLDVAGSVARAMGPAPEGVTMLGVVDDLGEHYSRAGIVISPLYTGSGLKIKLIEAMAAGKAVVGTRVTAQGVEQIVNDAMALADEPHAFAAAVADLAGDRTKRRALGEAALHCARAHFSTAAAFADLVAHVRGNRTQAARNSLPAEAPASQ